MCSNNIDDMYINDSFRHQFIGKDTTHLLNTYKLLYEDRFSCDIL